ncbi:anti-phage dCTP deaminase [Sphingomicrobium lutaoense]|uniref:Deoxycytidylate deaminase n=1 Tax=Sphingomicrobium lutaoense TaxID=515949 RepID=A0A839Z119_9SPHN|nr:anti-phage dCTP deaminase [Sphingomicrobium lutaoense]MBB3763265.1 deoxycytidylate deaminase [Sphingomicrobium lutaoense]
MANEPKAKTHPELVIGIAGPIGIDIDAMTDEITRALKSVGYDSHPIRVTQLMEKYEAPGVKKAKKDYFSQMNYKMDYANKLCEVADDPAFLMRVAVQGIAQVRRAQNATKGQNSATQGEGEPTEEEDPQVLPSTAYIIRQLKRPQEVELLRKIYGKLFVLVSGYGSEEHRRARVLEKGRSTLPVSTKRPDLERKTAALIERDHDEGLSKHAQHLRDTFHHADVFVDGINRDQMKTGIERFFNAFFGRVDVGPTKSEYGMYAAKAASLRSTDLSRQVGAAAFTQDGDLICQGCNEVPKAFGGTYWYGEEPDYRDVRLGFDPNDSLKKDVIRDLLEKLEDGGLLSAAIKDAVWSEDFVDELLGRVEKDAQHIGCLKDSLITALTEYGRVVHAEMVAICDAARLGKPLKGSILYVTTFPCHGCTKHILAVGIKRVVYMEPYPKSRAKELHSHEIEIEKLSENKLSFLPFLGISPYRYRDIFEKQSRKTGGKARTWYSEDDEPRPMLPISDPIYLENEMLEVAKMGGSFGPAGDPKPQIDE